MKNDSFFTFLISLILLILLFTSCNTTEPPPDGEKPTLELKLEDVSCTEAWLQLTITNIQIPNNISLLINGSVKKTFTLNTQDSLLYIDSLLPNQTYKILAAMQQPVPMGYNNASNELSVTTLDTTSHNFTWQAFTFGEHSSSVLYDVAIINENNIWAVGEIYTEDSYTYDSLGNWIDPYNAVHWDGENWKLVRIYYNYNGTNSWSPIRTILAFNSNDIWFGAGIHWNGVDFITKPMNINFPYQINKMWGASSNDFYIVGNNGNIAHYQNGSWTKIESGTTVNLYDVWGATDGKTVWTCGYSGDYANSVLIRIKDGITEKIYEGSSNGQSNGYYVGPMSGVWTDNKYRVFLMTGSGIYIQQNSNEFFLEKEIMRFSHGSYGIDGTRSNNIFACGDEFVGHWNGSTYNDYPELYRQFRTYYNINTKGNVVCVVGTDYSDTLNFGAIIALGYK